MMRFAAAPWPLFLKLSSLAATLAMLAMWYFMAAQIPHGTRVPFAETFGTLISFVPPALLFGASLFVVRGYEIGPRELRIERLLWTTRLELAPPVSVEHDPAAMKCSMRLFGNGGFYAFTGLYRNKALGNYRAFVTDPARSVVLKCANRTLVLSPDRPELFVARAASLFPDARR